MSKRRSLVRSARRDKATTTNGIFVGYCNPGTVDAQFMYSFTNMIFHDAEREQLIIKHGGWVGLETSPRIAIARNLIVRKFLASKATWLLMLDADMGFTEDLPYRLLETALEHQFAMVGGLCFAGGHSVAMYPTLYVLSPDPAKRAKLEVSRLEEYPRDAVVSVDATGAACTLIHRDVLEAMEVQWGETPHPWYAEGTHLNAEYGEDITFCLRARQLGFMIAVDTSVKLSHWKRYGLTEELYDEMLQNRPLTSVDAANQVSPIA